MRLPRALRPRDASPLPLHRAPATTESRSRPPQKPEPKRQPSRPHLFRRVGGDGPSLTTMTPVPSHSWHSRGGQPRSPVPLQIGHLVRLISSSGLEKTYL